MKLKIVVTFLATSVATYPQVLSGGLLGQYSQLQQQMMDAVDAKPNPSSSFNADLQRISVSGIHEWRAPREGDARGPCPGLNALANHGYLPRNGFGTILDFVGATTTVFGMGPVLAVVLSVYGAVIDGLVLGWSIGHEDGLRRGIGGSRGNYETDNSPMRGDLHQYGSNSDLVLSQFQPFYDLQPDDSTANYNIPVLAQFRALRFRESIEKNPWFYYGPFSGTTVSIAAYSFIFRFFANHTAEAPDGVLNGEVLKSFKGITGTRDDFTWTRGHERIPENWYRRSLSDPYDLAGVAADGGVFGETTPESLQSGCNTGAVNSYTPINTAYQDFDFSQPTAGVCFAVGSILGATNLLPVVGDVVSMLILPLRNVLDCPTVPVRNDSVADVCPGYSFYGGPTGEIAPGAIRN
ncbi:Putative chloroperoxidase [Septoria linicola]|uniref:Chloroperoxidase n=1 Tax=Septoria linicola TaxID=215465 RepID=A0A9Q9EN07_9PEZI|nr:putative chloroperoxidase [Septoria linicola]USW55008.1 Putative chloroperoxidase [Septoria linicola]